MPPSRSLGGDGGDMLDDGVDRRSIHNLGLMEKGLSRGLETRNLSPMVDLKIRESQGMRSTGRFRVRRLASRRGP